MQPDDQPEVRAALHPALRQIRWRDRAEIGARRADVQAMGALGDHRGPPYSRHADCFVGPVGNTWGALQGFHTVRIRVSSDLGCDFPRDWAPRGASYTGCLHDLSRARHYLGFAGFGSARDRVSGI